MGRFGRVLAGVACLTVTLVTQAWAGGIWFYEQSTPDQGLAAAGRAASAKDASTAYTNPAGMSRLDSTQFLIGAGAFVIQSSFDTATGTTESGDGASLNSTLPLLSGFFVYNLAPDWKLGVTLNTLMGLAADYGDSWAGRYFLEKAALITLNFNPAVSYRVTDWLSVGGGFSVVGATFSNEAAINNPDPTLGDGKLELKSGAVGFGGNVGVLVEPWRGTRFGVAYRTPVKLNFNDIVDKVTNLGPGLNLILDIVGARLDVPRGSKVDITLTNPQEVMVSAYHDLTPALAIMGNFGWQNWAAFGRVPFSVQGTGINTTIDANYSNTYHVAIGAQYRVAPPWLLTAGFAYDSSPVSDANRTVAFAVDRQFRYAVGAQYDITKTLTLGAAFTLIDAGSASVNQAGGALRGTVVGDYSPNLLYAIGLNLIKRF